MHMKARSFLHRVLSVAGIANRSDILAADERVRLMIGRQESRRARSATYTRIRDAEFQVFSQGGEDGIVQYLLGKVPIKKTSFVEFGVQDYRESNTRFLVNNDGWSGTIIDGGEDHIAFVRETGLDWRMGLKAISAFLDRENINEVLDGAGVTGDIGLLSIDVDGNDYWILESLQAASPRILIVEYNSTFGPDIAVTVPYDARFARTDAHFSNLYYGASLQALCLLATRKGYTFAGCNSAGNNAFFVRTDVAGSVAPASAADEFVSSRFLESRDRLGRLTLVESGIDRLRLLAELPLVRVEDGTVATIAELYGID
jgi:hypothetical protein